jgi:small subunit ribosomal protein S6
MAFPKQWQFLTQVCRKEKTVRNYEVVFVAAPTLTSEELDSFINHIQTVVEGKNGKVVKVDNWGKKSLAYKIKKFREAYYVILSIEGDGSAIAEVERRFRVTDYIIRFISVRIDEDVKRSEKIKAARQKKGSKTASNVSTIPDPLMGMESEQAAPSDL